MTEDEWLISERSGPMLDYLGCAPGGGKLLKRQQRLRPSHRKLRLFACACLRPFQHLLDLCGQRAIEVAERFAEGLAIEEERAAAESEVDQTPALRGDGRSPDYWFAAATRHVVDSSPRVAAYSTASNVLSALATAMAPAEWGEAVPSWVPADGDATVNRSQACLLRELFGNPFRTMTVSPLWLGWNDGTIPKLSKGIYDDRAFDRLPILADALEDAGCTNAEILHHCRQVGEHRQGCWVVDLILGRQ
jgi:hypothetical protein